MRRLRSPLALAATSSRMERSSDVLLRPPSEIDTEPWRLTCT